MQRERRFQTHPNRYGPGKVHRYRYSPEARTWYVVCRQPFNNPHGALVDPATPVTCKKCKV